MCGIHGFVGSKIRSYNADNFIRSGFVAGSLRGVDSSGIASIDVAKNISVYQKLPMMGPLFIGDRYADTLIKEAADINTITICHTRAATVGPRGIDGAHPFVVETKDRELIGVHNGTLTAWGMNKTAADFDVDSEWALNHIFDNGDDAFKDFRGAYTFAWWDSKESCVLNIARNDQRPMWVAFTADGGMAYASEAGMLHWLCEREGIKLDGAIRELEAGHHYKFEMNKVKDYSKVRLPVPSTPVYAPPPITRSHYKSKSVVERVQEFLDTFNVVETPKTSLVLVPKVDPITEKAPTKGPAVTVNEQQNARDLGVMMNRGEFVPQYLDDDGTLYGSFLCAGADMSAIIRNSTLINWDNDTVWEVTVIGMMDDKDNEITLICSKPSVQLSTVH